MSRRGREPLLGGVTAAVRFDIVGDGGTHSWLLAIGQGQLGVSQANAEADCVISTDEALFSALARGETNAMAAVLRGEVAVTGDPDLVVAVQRLFPGPPPSAGSTEPSREGRPV